MIYNEPTTLPDSEPTDASARNSSGFQAYLKASCQVEMFDDLSRQTKQFGVVRERIEPDLKGQPATDQYLLLGWDTEYQALQPLYTQQDVSKKLARYEVLSYQFYAKVSGSSYRMIVIPPKNQRINFADAIAYVIAKLTSINVRVPRTIVFVGHFNKADFPAFADRGQSYRMLSAIRNSLVTLKWPVRVRIMFSDDDEEDYEEFRVHVRDTILLAPAGQKSLEAIGDLIGQPKMKLHSNPAQELELKKNMRVVRDNYEDLFLEYALRDAEISALYYERLMVLYRTISGKQSFPTSLSNIGVKLLLDEWRTSAPPIDRLQAIGKEIHKNEQWNDKTGSFRTIKEEPYTEEVNWEVAFATECYHGGRSEQMWFGPSNEDNFSDYDLAAAYPTAMAMLNQPDWVSIRPVLDVNDIGLDNFAFACVDFEFPATVRYPTLPVRTANGILFPLTGRSYCCAPEIELARTLGAKLQLKRAVVVDTTDNKLFLPFIRKSIKLRTEARTDLEKAFWKEATNSVYGKTGQGLREKRVFNLKSKKTQTIPPSPITNPFYAAFITSMVRAVVGEIINSIPRNKFIFSVTTDGFLTNAIDADIAQSLQGKIAKAFGGTRKQLTGDPSVVSKKHSIKRLIGWRTRGQATLVPDHSIGAKGIVLAKAGIKTPAYTTTLSEQNDYIVEQFLTRTPGRKFIVDTMTTNREIMLFNADNVMKRSERAISMEYDFKRRPIAAWDIECESKNTRLKHLVFQTAPWTTADDARVARQTWDAYSKKNVKVIIEGSKNKFRTVKRHLHCLKTLDDFRTFAAFYDGKLATKGSTHLRSDMSRLRRDLCRAFQHGEAGFHNLRRGLTAHQFADLLNRCGFADKNRVARTHVEAGVRTNFEKHTTPPTDQVLGVLQKLEQLIPTLRAVDIIASVKNLPLLSSAIRDQ